MAKNKFVPRKHRHKPKKYIIIPCNESSYHFRVYKKSLSSYKLVGRAKVKLNLNIDLYSFDPKTRPDLEADREYLSVLVSFAYMKRISIKN